MRTWTACVQCRRSEIGANRPNTCPATNTQRLTPIAAASAGTERTGGEAAEEMMKDYVRHGLVRDDTGLVGVLSMRDVLAAYTT